MRSSTESDHIDELSKYIDELGIFHKQLRSRMGRRNKSKKWAIWLLQGASLSLSRSVVKAAERNDPENFMLISDRYADELLGLIAYFNRKTTPANVVKDWFDGDLWTTPKVSRMSKAEKIQEREDRALYVSEHGCHWDRDSRTNHLKSKAHHPFYGNVRYSFMYSPTKGNDDSYDLVSDHESLARINHYALRLLVESSAFALCNGDNVFEYTDEDYVTLSEIHNAISDGRKYKKLAESSFR